MQGLSILAGISVAIGIVAVMFRPSFERTETGSILMFYSEPRNPEVRYYVVIKD